MSSATRTLKLHKWELKFWEAFCDSDIGLGSHDLIPRLTIELEIDGDVKKVEFDFGSPSQRLLIECDGLGGFDRRERRERLGGHQSAKGMRNDSAKRNAAVLDGWRVLVFPSSRLDSKPRMARAVEEVCIALCVFGDSRRSDGPAVLVEVMEEIDVK